jgi:hypothetical protein
MCVDWVLCVHVFRGVINFLKKNTETTLWNAAYSFSHQQWASFSWVHVHIDCEQMLAQVTSQPDRQQFFSTRQTASTLPLQSLSTILVTWFGNTLGFLGCKAELIDDYLPTFLVNRSVPYSKVFALLELWRSDCKFVETHSAFWYVRQSWFMGIYRRFGTTFLSHIQRCLHCLYFEDLTASLFKHIRLSGMLGRVDWWLFTDVSGQPFGPIFKGVCTAWTLKIWLQVCWNTFGFLGC